jgi:hypothetical protein
VVLSGHGEGASYVRVDVFVDTRLFLRDWPRGLGQATLDGPDLVCDWPLRMGQARGSTLARTSYPGRAAVLATYPCRFQAQNQSRQSLVNGGRLGPSTRSGISQIRRKSDNSRGWSRDLHIFRGWRVSANLSSVAVWIPPLT